MSETNSNISKFSGEQCIINFDKTYVVLCDKYEIKGNFFICYFEDSHILVNMNHIIYIKQKDDKYRIGYLVPSLTQGKIVEIQNKMITLEIYNSMVKKYYYNIIPVKNIKGIKILKDGFNESFDED